MGGPEAHFSQNEFELTKLFAGQASIALENAEAHGEVKVQAEHDALTGLRNHGPFQRELARDDRRGRRPVRAPDDGSRPVQGLQRHLRPSGRRRAPGRRSPGDRAGDPGRRPGLSLRRRRVRGHPARREPDEADEVAERIRQAVRDIADRTGPHVTISVGVACYPEDGATKDELVEAADQALYLASLARATAPERRRPTRTSPPSTRRRSRCWTAASPDELLETILTRAAALLGTPHGYIYLVEPDGENLVVPSRHGDLRRLRRATGCRSTEGVGGDVVRDRRGGRGRRLRHLVRAGPTTFRRPCSGRSSACRSPRARASSA